MVDGKDQFFGKPYPVFASGSDEGNLELLQVAIPKFTQVLAIRLVFFGKLLKANLEGSLKKSEFFLFHEYTRKKYPRQDSNLRPWD